MLSDELLAKIKCEPPGSVSTALDVDIDSGNRWCGMCGSPDVHLHCDCPRCGHLTDYFQINTTATALGSWRDLRRYCQGKGIKVSTHESEDNLALVLAALREKEKEEDASLDGDGAWGEIDDNY